MSSVTHIPRYSAFFEVNKIMLVTQPLCRGARAVSPHPHFATGMFASELVVWERRIHDEIIDIILRGVAWKFEEVVGELLCLCAGDVPLCLWRGLSVWVLDKSPSKCPRKLQ